MCKTLITFLDREINSRVYNLNKFKDKVLLEVSELEQKFEVKGTSESSLSFEYPERQFVEYSRWLYAMELSMLIKYSGYEKRLILNVHQLMYDDFKVTIVPVFIRFDNSTEFVKALDRTPGDMVISDRGVTSLKYFNGIPIARNIASSGTTVLYEVPVNQHGTEKRIECSWCTDSVVSNPYDGSAPVTVDTRWNISDRDISNFIRV